MVIPITNRLIIKGFKTSSSLKNSEIIHKALAEIQKSIAKLCTNSTYIFLFLYNSQIAAEIVGAIITKADIVKCDAHNASLTNHKKT